MADTSGMTEDENMPPTAEVLLELVVPLVATRWYDIGSALGLDCETLGSNNKQVTMCCTELFKMWLKSDSVSWYQLIEALKSIKLEKKAEEIERLLKWKYNRKITASVADDLTSITKMVHFQSYKKLQPSILYETKALIKSEDTATCITLYTATPEGSGNESPISYIQKIFHDPFDNDPTKIILIEGAPGIGKTTLCIEIADKWIKNELPFCKLLLFMLLRDPNVQKISTIQQFAEYFTQSANEASLLCSYLENKENVTIILDGYDSKLHNSSFFTKLIQGHYLPKARIVLTSQPSASGCLHDAVNRKIEILGFSESSRERYFSVALKRSPLKLEKLHNHLQQNINIDALCYTPFVMSVLTFLCLRQPDNLPTTATKLYNSFIVHKICDYLKAQNMISKDKISEMKQFPQAVQETLQQLQKFAFRCLVEDKFVFTSEELPDVCQNDFLGFGLLQSVEHSNNTMSYNTMTYNFVHLSIQEFLAACYIASLETDEADQLSPLELFFRRDFFCEKVHFSNMWAFYCGLTSRNGKGHSELIVPLQPRKHYLNHMFQSNLWFQSSSISFPQESLHHDLQSLTFTMRTLLSQMDGFHDSKTPVSCKLCCFVLGSEEMSTANNIKLKVACNHQIGSCLEDDLLFQVMFKDPIKMLYVFRCFLEAEDNTPCDQLFHLDIVNLKNHKLVIPFQLESLGLFLVNVKCDELILSNCQIGDNGINLLHRYMCGDAGKKPKISTLDFMENDLTEISLPLIGDIIVHVQPHTLKLGCNQFVCMEGLANAVATSSTLKVLNLWGCGITAQEAAPISDMMTVLEELIVSNNSLSDDGAIILAEGLIKARSLRVLYINDNNIGPSGTVTIACALLHNTSLEVLNMTNNGIGQDGATAIANAIMKNKTLTELLLYGNRTLDEDSAIVILEMLYNSNSTITKLGLSLELASNNCIKSYVENINVRRMRHHKPDVKFTLY